MSEDTNPPADPAPTPAPPPAPKLHELAQAVEDAEDAHAAALEKSNASQSRAKADADAEADAHGKLRGARDLLIATAQQIQ